MTQRLLWRHQGNKTGLMHSLSQHIQGNLSTQCHPRKLPIIQEERDLVTRPKTTRCRAAHRCTHCFREKHPMKRFRALAKLHPHLAILDSLGNRVSTCLLNQDFDNPLDSTLPSSAIRSMPISAHFLRTSAENKGVRMSAAKKGLKVSLPGIVAGSV